MDIGGRLRADDGEPPLEVERPFEIGARFGRRRVLQCRELMVQLRNASIGAAGHVDGRACEREDHGEQERNDDRLHINLTETS